MADRAEEGGEPDGRDALIRIADALERLSPRVPAPANLEAFPAYGWDGARLAGIATIEAPALSLLKGIDRQKQTVATNVARHAAGAAAHDMLLWGARGMGKSALVRASVVSAGGRLGLVQAAGDALASLPTLLRLLRGSERPFLLFIDDIGFAEGDPAPARMLRSLMDGGVEPRPANVRLAVTANRRAILARDASEQADPLNPRDAVDDALALSDRFGLSVGFHECSQADYLAIVGGYAAHFALDWREDDALEWVRRRGARSGRAARHYITELAGRSGRSLE